MLIGHIPKNVEAISRLSEVLMDYRTEEEKRICEVCCDLICTRHCPIVRKEIERREEKEGDNK